MEDIPTINRYYPTTKNNIITKPIKLIKIIDDKYKINKFF